MSGRPESLFPLFTELTGLDGVGPKTAKALEKLGISYPRDLLLTPPVSYTDRSLRRTFRGLQLPTTATVEVTVGEHHPPKTKGRPYRIFVRDASEEFQLVYFHGREAWLRGRLPEGEIRIVSGKLELFDGYAQMVHPDHVLSQAEAAGLPELEPVYPLGAGLTQHSMAKAVGEALVRAPDLVEWIEPSIVSKQSWPGWLSSLGQMHEPGASGRSGALLGRTRLAYDELLSHQLTLALARAHLRRSKGRASEATGVLTGKLLKSLPFTPTDAQIRTSEEIKADMAADLRMNRLLQGDVGAGKTLVALLAMLMAVEAGGQAALMAPTEILARQHHATIGALLARTGQTAELLTGRDKGAERRGKLDRLARGETQIAIGTHALFQKDVEFGDLCLAVIDEQHRFGVQQRLDMARKGRGADILVMTATPIPRSLALASYGDMDLSVLDEKPPGRTPVETVLVSSGRIEEVVARLRAALDEGRQAYWVCPLVEESESVDFAAATERAAMLGAALGHDRVGLVHGRMPAAEKDATMAGFVEGRLRLLVATTVIEVGVDVPAASIMVIEQAERFGLSQLHQLRGRVGRGAERSSCVMVYDPPLGAAAHARLSVLRETEDGFRIAEADLALRGAGDLIGHAQSGLPRFRIADLERDRDLMQMAQDEARLVLARDPGLDGSRGEALRCLLYLMGRDEAVRLLTVG